MGTGRRQRVGMPARSSLPALSHLLLDLGGVATTADLRAAASPSTLCRAVRRGDLARLHHGFYCFPHIAALDVDGDPDGAVRSWARWDEGPVPAEALVLIRRHARARAYRGALALRCAAAHHQWPILVQPRTIEIALPRGRYRPTGSGARFRHVALSADELLEAVTSPIRTVLDAARLLPFDEALAIADSALRSGAVGPHELVEAGHLARGRQVERVRRVCRHADGGAANPFESALRAVLLDVDGVHLQTQVPITGLSRTTRVDLADVSRRLVVEGESREFHGTEERFYADCRRYTELVAAGWTVLRFTLPQVRSDPGWVRATTLEAMRTARSGD